VEGRATAAALAAEGMRVVVADVDFAGAEATAKELGAAVAIEVDVTEPASFAKLLDRTADELGRLDVLVNNATNSTALDGSIRRRNPYGVAPALSRC
jgi:NAD(P)-dependent dehydrogenase (short-subunit alcohol dehydrogenase family)